MDVPVRALDAVLDGRWPTLIKVDVEGFESAVLAGAACALADPALLDVITALTGSGARYGFHDYALHRDLLGCGFEAVRYRPFERVLESLHGARSGSGNTLYVRDAGRLAERVRSAPRFAVGQGWSL